MAKSNTYRKHRTSGPVSKKQITVIMLICAEFGIDKEERKQLLQERYGESSTADLSSDQAGHFIAEYERKGFVLKSKAGQTKAGGSRLAPLRKPIPRDGNVIALVTPGEQEKIDQLGKLIPWREDNGLALFLEKRMGIKGGKVTTGKHAYMAIEGLKKMIANGMKKTYGPAWWQKTYSNPDINEFIRIHKPGEWR